MPPYFCQCHREQSEELQLLQKTPAKPASTLWMQMMIITMMMIMIWMHMMIITMTMTDKFKVEDLDDIQDKDHEL